MPNDESAEFTTDYVHALLLARWEDPEGPLQLSSDVLLDDLTEAAFFMNTRRFLQTLAQDDGAPATATGNLNRAFVGKVMNHMILNALYLGSLKRMSKVINEMDLWPLHLVRVVAEAAGLIARKKKRFRLTKLGKKMLPEDQAGALFRHLFLAYFRRFDLRYAFRVRDVPGIQDTMAVVLWRLHHVVDDWRSVRGLTREVLLPGVHQQLVASMVSDYDKEEWILTGYVLNPLIHLGLLEERETTEWPSISEDSMIRISPLWRKFLHFVPLSESEASFPA